MRSSRKIVSRMVARKNQKKKNRRYITAISLIIILAVISLTITPAITMRGNPQNALRPITKLQKDGTCFTRVTSKKDFDGNSCYVIISPEDNQALSYESKSGNKAHLTVAPVIGNKDSFTIKNDRGQSVAKGKIGNNLKWNIVYKGGMAQIQSVYDGRHYLNLKGSSIWSKSPQSLKLEYNDASGLWSIANKIDATKLYLSLDKTRVGIADNIDNKNTGWMIFKLDKQPIEGMKAPSGAENLSAPQGNTKSYIEPSGPLQGLYSLNGRPWNYASDPATSKIESMFSGTASDDGKVLADKSVIYGKDDYNAFSKYENGMFGVTLSALAQQYNIYNGEKADIPVDVVFILDTSGSMRANNAGTVTRAEAMVNAVNPAIKQIMDVNKNNRVGIVNFSDGAADFLPLDRYRTVAGDSKYLNYTAYAEIETAGGGIINSKGQSVMASTASQSTVGNWLGTYTQAGIAYANEMLQANKDITYTDDKGYTVKRKPIVILLSDGEPTYCTSNYANVLSGPHYGNGYSATPSNNQGVLGYYTILSANYYKSQVTSHYQRSAGFYTIGMGINETGEASATSGSITGDDYKRTVLNPTNENINSLTNSTSYYNGSTGLQMCTLLNNGNVGSYITVDSAYVDHLGGYTNNDVPVIVNPYKELGYNYSDKAYFGNMTGEQLNAVFDSIIKASMEKVEYGFALRENTAMTIVDPIGQGMEVKGVPVLRYNGINYSCTSQNEQNTGTSIVKNYTYKYEVQDNNVKRTVNLSYITIKIITNNDGIQNVSMDIPDKCMPVCFFERNTGIYYEELPLRLIYQVGLTNKAVTTAKPGDVFYTNRWNGEIANAVLRPMSNNPYYMEGGGYSNNSIDKSENTTGTNNIINSSVKQADSILILLGNNGKLTVGEEKQKISLSIIKKWQTAEGNEITDTSTMPDVTITLYRKTNATGAIPEYVSQIVLNNKNQWKTNLNELPYKDSSGNVYIYYVEEAPINGYTGTTSGSITMEDGTITITNRAIPEKGTIVTRKKWTNYFGNPIQDTSLLPEIKVELWRHVTYTEPDAVTLTIDYGHETKSVKVQRGSDVTFYVRANYYADWANFSQIYKDGYPTEDVSTDTSTSETQSSIRTTVLQTITVNNDMKVAYISVSPTYGNEIYANGFELLNLNYTAPGLGGTHTAPNELYKSNILNQNNNWQSIWTGVPTTEIKNGYTYTYKYYVKEISSVPGYTTTYSPENNIGIQGGTLDIINKSKTAMDVLPKTGGDGTSFYLISGMLVLLVSVIGLIYIKIFGGGDKPFS